ncbi:sulfite exporter TauE/SafE family protein [Acidimangrovimonas sediminis]|uniref:sulfite exporter TauE/SafE family protein n=1 Tax=Acidimangrovimonas sediminis TaxID=2056283 RepID=UPI000C805032|nr:sulfite exporter TauE/SafE family protein [Acidimangrovimonas sediminis]
MEHLLGGLPPETLALAAAVTLFAGFVKGAVGFAMPMIMISALGSFLPGHAALAALILPTLVTNLAQAFRDGPRAAVASAVNYRLILGVTVVFIVISAQFVLRIPNWLMFVLLGLPITAFALVQLAGLPLVIAIHHRRRAEVALGIIAGLYGGISGVWGPPILVYLLSIRCEKREQMRVQGVVFLLGSTILLAAHLRSGVLNAQTVPLSAALVLPAALGMALGRGAHERLDPARFRWWTLVLLTLTGLNLVRRSLMG